MSPRVVRSRGGSGVPGGSAGSRAPYVQPLEQVAVQVPEQRYEHVDALDQLEPRQVLRLQAGLGAARADLVHRHRHPGPFANARELTDLLLGFDDAPFHDLAAGPHPGTQRALHETGVVGLAAAAARAILGAYQRAKGSLPLGRCQLLGSGSAWQDLQPDVPHMPAGSALLIGAALYSVALSVMRTAAMTLVSGGDDGAALAAAKDTVSDLAAVDVLGALASVLDFARTELLPATALMSFAPGVDPDQPARAAAAPDVALGTDEADGRLQGVGALGPRLLMSHGCKILNGPLRLLIEADEGGRGASLEDTAAAFLTALQRSGAVEALAAVLLATPPLPPLPPGVPEAILYMNVCLELDLLSSLRASYKSRDVDAATAALLSGEQMLRLRAAALEQLAAVDGFSSSGGSAGGGGMLKAVTGSVYHEGPSAPALLTSAGCGVLPDVAAGAEHVAAVVRVLCLHAEALPSSPAELFGYGSGPSAAAGVQTMLWRFCGALEAILEARLDKASAEERRRGLPAALEVQAWLLRGLVARYNGPVMGPLDVLHAAWALQDATAALPQSQGGLSAWKQLSPSAREDAARRLAGARLLPTLERLLQWLAAEGDLDGRVHNFSGSASDYFTRVFGPILRDVVAAGLQLRGVGCWRPSEELGLLVLTAKLVRVDAARLRAEHVAGSLRSGTTPPSFSRLYFLTKYCIGASKSLLTELALAAAPSDAAVAAARRVVGEVLDVCCVAAVEGVAAEARVLAEALDVEHGSGRQIAVVPLAGSAAAMAGWLLDACCCASPSALLHAAPQRAVAAMAPLLLKLRRAAAATAPSNSGVAGDLDVAAGVLVRAVAVLAGDDALRGLVPGWVWAARPEAGAADGCVEVDLELEALAALAATDSPTAPASPLVVLRSAAAAATLSGCDRAAGEAAAPVVAEAARCWLLELGLYSSAGAEAAQRRWRTEFGGAAAGDTPSWPPRGLRMCGSRCCSTFGGAAGAESLKLRRCQGCRRVRYCDRACQRADWPAHKLVCGALAAEGLAADGAE
ncbi:SET domain and MYND-type zinc finger protein 6 [Tetrabaena socialis]|uniref:SET domain and MYND-type zinc finger protein 6 n=1 Tax=Tetrabaena socialis TaxID=47790 RepID=A0A2J8ACZ2_9CHLO|nr:SET domain and MYND-type zinc finger protein 6 [Tetrabaena socialis]|eukprot:PNH10382.1 SET domain and MYND-type zinc finger protein 6 [Tetrabaena socialis]